MPALVLLARRAYEQRSRALGAAVAILGLVGYAYLPEIGESHFSSTRGLASLPTTDPYPLVAVLDLGCLCRFARAGASATAQAAGWRPARCEPQGHHQQP